MEPVSGPDPGALLVEDLLGSLEKAAQRDDSRLLMKLFAGIAGQEPVLWTGRIIGFGSYHYRYDSGRQGDAPALGFSPRKGTFALYGLLVTDDAGEFLAALGKHRRGVGCLYVNKLSEVDLDVLGELARRGYAYTMAELHRP
ncbi:MULTISPECIES: DUF1801 domain-containing protein [Arthrobacter]|uniref:DUF1801 domain-containing protein n=2 Tax=Arthrobacter TaxID=1663 RepID=A0ABU9KJ54_9MICC|nr:DUF1801 domain-containing protein [Arthrobacter sp. YJM1]MDP5226837.1 DUF1801 domain-containing protein [Arthrobacter sp. YJM1]